MKVIVRLLSAAALIFVFQTHGMMRLFSALRERCTSLLFRHTMLSSPRHQTHTYRFNTPRVNTQPAAFTPLTPSPPKTVAMLLAESWPCRKTNRTATYQYVKPYSDFTTALRDFQSLQLTRVRQLPIGFIGELPDNTIVNVRTTSSTKWPTIEVRNPVTGKIEKLRYVNSTKVT